MKLLTLDMPKHCLPFLRSIKHFFSCDTNFYRLVFSDFKVPVDPLYIVPKDWAISEGMVIDAVKEEKVGLEVFEAWAMASIKELDANSITVEFKNDPSTSKLPRNTNKIAPAGTFTKDWLWRDDLKVGSVVDIFDTQGKWFLGTVLDVRQSLKIPKMNEVYVGYRVYTEKGSKADSNRKRYEGWSENYDEWISSYSIRLQPPNYVTKKGAVHCRPSLDNDCTIPDDSTDVLLHVLLALIH